MASLMKPKKVEGYSQNVAFMQNLCKIYPTHSYNSVCYHRFFCYKIELFRELSNINVCYKKATWPVIFT